VRGGAKVYRVDLRIWSGDNYIGDGGRIWLSHGF